MWFSHIKNPGVRDIARLSSVLVGALVAGLLVAGGTAVWLVFAITEAVAAASR